MTAILVSVKGDFYELQKILTLATAALAGVVLLSQADVKADTYTIQNGDSFYSVAQMYGLCVYDLAALSGMSIYDTIFPGQVFADS